MVQPDDSPSAVPSSSRRRVYRVGELTRELKLTLERDYADIWVEGEVSTLRQPSSGHTYFVLKDEKTQIPAVMFRGARRFLRFRPTEGMAVLVRGRLTVYEPRGSYQIQVETMEPRGKGALQLAFEQLKEKLHREGLFATESKRALPSLPRRVGVVSSPSGAAFRDFCQVLHRRFPNVEIVLYPAQVQGPMAAPEIVKGIHVLNRLPGNPIELIVLTRGGGSLEDLWPFNEESVARAIHSSSLAVVSAVGHEIDTTIADYVADLRAPTPSAAAELISPTRRELIAAVDRLSQRATQAIDRRMTAQRHRVERLHEHHGFVALRHSVDARSQRVDELAYRLERLAEQALTLGRASHRRLASRLAEGRPDRRLSASKRRLSELAMRLQRVEHGITARAQRSLSQLTGKLEALSPLAVLGRGYSLSWDPNGMLLRSTSGLRRGDRLKVTLANGRLEATVDRVFHEKDEAADSSEVEDQA